MSDRLDRLEKIVESNSKAIEAWANESTEFRHRMEATVERLEGTTARIVDSIEILTQVVVRLDALVLFLYVPLVLIKTSMEYLEERHCKYHQIDSIYKLGSRF